MTLRRDLFKKFGLIAIWSAPVISSTILPAHAQATTVTATTPACSSSDRAIISISRTDPLEDIVFELFINNELVFLGSETAITNDCELNLSPGQHEISINLLIGTASGSGGYTLEIENGLINSYVSGGSLLSLTSVKATGEIAVATSANFIITV